ncbi:MAG: hypothetical protein IPJ94_23020 [Chloroflexi bacterium]|nr:hypothetical protein [Chloroflexota bacterium]
MYTLNKQQWIGSMCLLLLLLGLLFWGYQPTLALQAGITKIEQQPEDTGVLPQPVPGVITIRRDPDQLSVMPGQTAQVTIGVNGDLPAVCQGIPGRPLDVMLVFDRSTSAGDGPGSNLEFSKQAALTFIDQLQQPIYLGHPARPALFTNGYHHQLGRCFGADSFSRPAFNR